MGEKEKRRTRKERARGSRRMGYWEGSDGAVVMGVISNNKERMHADWKDNVCTRERERQTDRQTERQTNKRTE